MAQNITLLGASYQDVPAVNLPKTGGGTARFSDASVTTAIEEDVASGKIFLKSDGSQSVGTGGGSDIPIFTVTDGVATCNKTYAEMQSWPSEAVAIQIYVNNQLVATNAGSFYQATSSSLIYVMYEAGVPVASITYNSNGTIQLGQSSPSVETLTADSNGTYTSDYNKVWDEVVVNVSGGGSGGLEYETGTLTLSSDESTPIISFANTHTDVPIYINIVDVTETLATSNSNLYWTFMNWYTLNDAFIKTTSSSNMYGRYQYGWKTSSGASAGNIDCTNTGTGSGSLYSLVAEDRFGPYCGSANRYWRAGRTYKWIAVWAPTA